jgi:hypothetical protein
VYFDAGEFQAMAKHQGTSSPMLEKLFSWMPSWSVGGDSRASCSPRDRVTHHGTDGEHGFQAKTHQPAEDGGLMDVFNQMLER